MTGKEPLEDTSCCYDFPGAASYDSDMGDHEIGTAEIDDFGLYQLGDTAW